MKVELAWFGLVYFENFFLNLLCQLWIYFTFRKRKAVEGEQRFSQITDL